MGKFKELLIDSDRYKIADQLCLQYPFMSDFIKQAFDFREEDKVFDVIFNLELEIPPC